MTNQNKLKSFIKSKLQGDYTSVTYTGADLSTATVPMLKSMAEDLGGDVDAILAAPSAPLAPSAPSAPSAPTDGHSEKVRAALEALDKAYKEEQEQGAGGIDEDEVRILINDTVAPKFDEMQESIDKLEPLADTLRDIAATMAGGGATRLPIATAVASGTTPILDLVAPHYKAGTKNPTKICVSAPPSFGKSFSINLLGESYDKFVEWGCSGDMDEWSMLLGSCTPKSEGGFLVVDGKLTEAVRAASEGKTTLLFLDEVFRMSDTTMEAMLTFLAPQADASGNKVYRLTTKQNSGGVLETLTCSPEHLHIICATNLSGTIPPEAFLDRFLIKHVQYSEDIVAAISEGVASKYAIADAKALGVGYAKALGASRKMHASGQILKPLSIRDLERGCEHSAEAEALSVVEWIRPNMDALNMWNGDTGDLVADSVSGAKAIGDGLKAYVIDAIAKTK